MIIGMMPFPLLFPLLWHYALIPWLWIPLPEPCSKPHASEQTLTLNPDYPGISVTHAFQPPLAAHIICIERDSQLMN